MTRYGFPAEERLKPDLSPDQLGIQGTLTVQDKVPTT